MTVKQVAQTLFTTAASAALFTSSVFAQSYGSYGNGNPTPNDLLINKMVTNPTNGKLVESLSATDATFSPDPKAKNNEILFKIFVENKSGETMNPVTVTDTLPGYLTWVGGDGTYDASTNKVTINAGEIISGAKKEYSVLTKVVDASRLPKEKTIFCVLNTAKVTAPSRPTGQEDSAQACIQTGVLGASTLPVAGVSDLLVIVPFAAVGLTGLTFLGKKK